MKPISSALTPISFPIVLLLLLLGYSPHAGAVKLPKATYFPENNTWDVIVPETWDFATILEVTGQGSIVTNPTGTAANITVSSFDTDAALVYVNGSFSRYATNAKNYGLLKDLNMTLEAYSDEAWALPVVCEWPISGQYDQLGRVLYYVLLVFALVVHHHEWLVAGALASATLYSGIAAVQGFVQFIVINSQTPHDQAGDNDNQAIMGILAAGLLLSVPLINWSRTLRRLRTRPILIYWAIIVFMGYLFVIISNKETEYSDGWSRQGGSIMTCNTQEEIPNFKNLGFMSHSFISQYNCDDPCYNPNTQHPFHDTSSIMSRIDCDQFAWTESSGTDTSCFIQCPRSISDTCFIGHDGLTRKDFVLTNVAYYGVLPVAVFELFFVLCFGRRSPEQIRDNMFEFFVGHKLMEKFSSLPVEKRIGAPKSFKIRAAQGGALFFYFFAVLTYLVCIPAFIFNIVFQERLLNFWPDDNPPTEWSQWLQWVGIALVLGAAIVGKYHHSCHVHLARLFSERRRRRNTPVSKAKAKGRNLATWLQLKTWVTIERLSIEWRDLKDFIKSPFYLILDTTRDRTTDNPTVKFSFFGSLPFPDEEHRYSKDNYRGPWTKDSSWASFNVEFQVEADDHTIKSWERYQERNAYPMKSHSRLVYSVFLPPVPSYPDKRTVIAKANTLYIEEKVIADIDPPKIQAILTSAIVPGARKQSTASYSLQALNEEEEEQIRHNSAETVSRKSSSIAGTDEENELLQDSSPTSRESSYTPSPGPNGGPLNSHHFEPVDETNHAAAGQPVDRHRNDGPVFNPNRR